MFYHLEGIISEFDSNIVVVDCNGIGFELNATVNTISNLRKGEKAKLFVSESIGETNFDLYGFSKKDEKKCFEMLVSVSGIGPKAALSILSYNTPESLALAIMNDDIKALTVAPGIGKKIAQRVILELKDKINKDISHSGIELPLPVNNTAVNNTNISDAITALTVLGYSSMEIIPVIKSLNVDEMTAEQIIKAVLKNMVK